MQSSAVGFWLSPAQRSVWSTGKDGPANSVALVLMEGPCKADLLGEAVRSVASRREILRTVYHIAPGLKFPLQVVLEKGSVSWDETDLRSLDPESRNAELDALYRAAALQRFDVENGPVVRVLFIRLRDSAAFVVSAPALACDAHSLDLLAREIVLAYSYPETKEEVGAGDESIQYSQYAQWQNDLIESPDEEAAKAKAFWQRFAGLASPLAPSHSSGDRPSKPEHVPLILPPSTGRALEALSEKLDSRPEYLLLAVWQCFLARISGLSEFGVSVSFNGRTHQELAEVIGLIDKFLPRRARLYPHSLLSDIVAEVAGSFAEGEEWQEYFDPGTADTCNALPGFEFLHSRIDGDYADVRCSLLRQSAVTRRMPILLSARRNPSAFTLDFQFDAGQIAREEIERWSGSFLVLLESALASPATPLRLLPLLTAAELSTQIDEWNRTDAEYPLRCIQELFEEQAAKVPDRPAVRCGDNELTYRQLNERANQLAHRLRRLNLRPTAPVALCTSPGVDTIAGLLAIIKAGGACMPLSLENPKARLSMQLENAEAILTERLLVPSLPEFRGPLICIDVERSLEEPCEDPELRNSPDDPVYVIYTSGSTGVPKGVVVRHRNLSNYTHYIRNWLSLNRFPEGLHFAAVTTISADLGNTCIYPSLLSGGCLHMIPKDVAGETGRLAEYFQLHPIDVLKIVPSHLNALLETDEGRNVLPQRYLIVGGETLRQSMVDRIGVMAPTCEILNHYGPTETTVGSLTFRLNAPGAEGSGETVPIGRPISNTRIYILDESRQPVPAGVPGELYIAGAGVAAGYLNQPELTQERFLPNPWRADETMYRTGDRVRYLPDGNVEFLGRADNQVKIRGYRVEPGEVETLLLRYVPVREAVVTIRPDGRGDPRLVAYAAMRHGHSFDPDAIRDYLAEHVPSYMIPAVIVPVPRIPITSNGKIDRGALPDPAESELQQTRAVVPPGNATEAAIAEIWADVFRRSPISVDDNFFELGGHSLMATQVISRIRVRFGVAVDIRVLFDGPTIRSLASAVGIAEANNLKPAEPEITRAARVPRRI